MHLLQFGLGLACWLAATPFRVGGQDDTIEITVNQPTGLAGITQASDSIQCIRL